MVDPAKARRLLDLYERYRGYLRTLAERPDAELRADFAVMGGVQHYMLLAVETVLDLGSHVISSEGYEAPANYADIFRVLVKEGVIADELGEQLMAMARFRNVLVHLYAEVDEERVLRILRESFGDLDLFVRTLRERFGDSLRAGES